MTVLEVENHRFVFHLNLQLRSSDWDLTWIYLVLLCILWTKKEFLWTRPSCLIVLEPLLWHLYDRMLTDSVSSLLWPQYKNLKSEKTLVFKKKIPLFAKNNLIKKAFQWLNNLRLRNLLFLPIRMLGKTLALFSAYWKKMFPVFRSFDLFLGSLFLQCE